MRTSFAFFLLVVGIASTEPMAAQADREPRPGDRGEQCRQAAAVLERAQPSSRMRWANETIRACPEEAPSVLARRWRTVEADTQQVSWLATATGGIRDRRLYNVLREIVLDASRPEVARVGAMIALIEYVDPCSAHSLVTLKPPPGEIGMIRMSWPSSTYGGQIHGPEPVREALGRPVLAVLEQVASRKDTEPRAVWYAAAVLAKSLSFRLARGISR